MAKKMMVLFPSQFSNTMTQSCVVLCILVKHCKIVSPVAIAHGPSERTTPKAEFLAPATMASEPRLDPGSSG